MLIARQFRAIAVACIVAFVLVLPGSAHAQAGPVFGVFNSGGSPSTTFAPGDTIFARSQDPCPIPLELVGLILQSTPPVGANTTSDGTGAWNASATVPTTQPLGPMQVGARCMNPATGATVSIYTPIVVTIALVVPTTTTTVPSTTTTAITTTTTTSSTTTSTRFVLPPNFTVPPSLRVNIVIQPSVENSCRVSSPNYAFCIHVSSTPPSVRVSGTDLLPESDVSLSGHSQEVSLGTARTDATGAFSTTVTIPTDFAPGPHQIIVLGLDANGDPVAVATDFEIVSQTRVAAQPATLPVTGSSAGFFVGLGAALLALGAALQVVARRKSTGPLSREAP